MVFSSISFLYYFLPIAVIAYYAVPKKFRNPVLLLASLVFYTWGGGAFVFLLGVSTVADFFCGKLAKAGMENGNRAMTGWAVTGSVTVNIGLLIYYKYSNFFIEQINAIAGHFGWGQIAWTTVVLPIGISFFNFQSMSYTMDVVKGRARPISNILDFALYVTLFPQLIAGPIVRFHEIAEELQERRESFERFTGGLLRFMFGLSKKVLVADAVAPLADRVFSGDGVGIPTLAVWIGVLAYTVQIYFDFSGYSDMAIGLGHMFGFSFPENFKRPYSAISVTDFWRRWHITLSNWFRDYLFIPLGGSRGSTRATYRNLAIVFLLTGAWHGASWTFVVWGIYHGLILIGERLVHLREPSTLLFFHRARTLFLVIFGWVLFRSETLGQAWSLSKSMVMWTAGSPFAALEVAPSDRSILILGLAMLVVFLPGHIHLGAILPASEPRLAPALRFVTLFILVPLTLLEIISGTFSPFLYFRF